MTTKEGSIAEALREVFIDVNETDLNLEPATIVNATKHLARSVAKLADAIEHYCRIQEGK